MSSDGKLIDFSSERSKRIHELHDKRLDEMRQAFEQAMPLDRDTRKKARRKPKKR